MGPAGPKGDTGLTGLTGPTGPQGPPGVNAKAFRAGTTAMTSGAKTKAVTFSSPMPSANYRVLFELPASVATATWATNKTASGFTTNVTTGFNGTLGYAAVEDN